MGRAVLLGGVRAARRVEIICFRNEGVQFGLTVYEAGEEDL
jgi:hypothetical protein